MNEHGAQILLKQDRRDPVRGRGLGLGEAVNSSEVRKRGERKQCGIISLARKAAVGTFVQSRESEINLSENGNVLKLKKNEIFHKAQRPDPGSH